MGLDTDHSAWRGSDGPVGPPPSILELVAAGELDADLAALLWLLVEARVPLVVAAARPLAGKTTLLTALLEFLPPGTRRIFLRGIGEDFAWLADAPALGWRPDAPPDEALAADPATTYLLAVELSDRLPVHAWGAVARTAIRAVGLGYGLGTTVRADSLEEMLAVLRDPGLGLADDELARLGVVLVLRVLSGSEPIADDPSPHPHAEGRRRVGGPAGHAGDAPLPGRRDRGAGVGRVVAAHYLRPPMRDAGGHVQRLAPALLAAWDERSGGFEHFAWGVTQELAARVGRGTGDFEQEHGQRAGYLGGLVAAGSTSPDQTRAAIAAYLAGGGGSRRAGAGATDGPGTGLPRV